MNSFHISKEISADEVQAHGNLGTHIATKSSGDAKNLHVVQGGGGNHLGSQASGTAKVLSFGFNKNNINPSDTQEDRAAQAKEEASNREEQSKRVDGKVELDLTPITEKLNEAGTFNLNDVGPDFHERIEQELANIEVLLKDLYTGALKQEEVLSDQKLNEKSLLEFFDKYSGNYHKTKTNILAIMLAGLYIALDDWEGAKTNLDRIENPDTTDENTENAGIHRAYYIMKANLEIEAKNFKKARELLKKCWNIQQKYFLDGKENFLDFYTTSMGKIHLNEGDLKEAEKCFRDALALRLSSNNPRLISSSFNDLALLCIQKKTEVRPTEVDALRKQASKYLEEAVKHDKIFKEELKTDKYKILSGQVDLKRPSLNRTKAACL